MYNRTTYEMLTNGPNPVERFVTAKNRSTKIYNFLFFFLCCCFHFDHVCLCVCLPFGPSIVCLLAIVTKVFNKMKWKRRQQKERERETEYECMKNIQRQSERQSWHWRERRESLIYFPYRSHDIRHTIVVSMKLIASHTNFEIHH